MAAKKKVAPPVKALLKTEADYEPVNRWWEKEDGALAGARGAKKWDSFEHHGLMFAPDYEPHGVPLRYDGELIALDNEAEEIATYFCSVFGSPYETKEVFINNFWSVFKSVLPADTKITEFSKCSFELINNWRNEE